MKNKEPTIYEEALGMTIEKYGAELIEKYDKALREAILERLWKIPRRIIGNAVPDIQLPQAETAINEAKVEEKEV